MTNTKEKIAYIAVMALYGTTGILKRFIPFSSNFISFTRAVVATVFLLAIIIIGKRKIDVNAVKKNLKWLILVGFLLAFNWITYFEACTYTTVAKATLCYYMAPVIVILLSPVLYKEKLSVKKIICVIVAVIGMVMVSGVLSDTVVGDFRGIIMGFIAASLYAMIVIFSRKIKDIESYDKTIVQLFVAAITLLPVILFSKGTTVPNATLWQWAVLLLIGVLNTGFAYTVYFGTITKMKAQTIAIFAYADPVVSVLLSALVLKEPLGLTGIVGAVLIIGAMIISEL